MRTHTIAVCGAGIGGLASAIALHRSGHQVTLFERFEASRPVGSGLMLQPTGQAALARLDLLEPAKKFARRIDGIQGDTRSGRTIFDLDYTSLGESTFALGIHRAALHHVLDVERSRRAIPIITSTTIAASDVLGPKRTLVDENGTDLGGFDLVIDATGLNSKLRRRYARISLDRPYHYGAVWGVVREPDGWSRRHTLAQRYDGARFMIGLLPIGRLAGSEEPLVAFFWSLKTADVESWRATPFAEWQQQCIDLWPASEPFVRQFSRHANLTAASYSDVVLASPCVERLAFIGDAGRAASPQLGQGANLALIDAIVLADDVSNEPTIEAALASFARRRQPHTSIYGRASRLLTPFFQSDSRLAGAVRDLTFSPMARIPYLRREMVRTLAGLKTGFFSHQSPDQLVGPARTSLPVDRFSDEPTAPAAD